MRKIKFRGIAVSSGKWVYGNYIHSKRFRGCSNEYRIHQQETGIESDVHPETVGQFTGLTDKNGVDIYEGDLVKFQENDMQHEVSVYGNSFVLSESGKTRVYNWTGRYVEVIGNIHKNQTT